MPRPCGACEAPNSIHARTCRECGAELGEAGPPEPLAPASAAARHPLFWVGIAAVLGIVFAVTLTQLDRSTDTRSDAQKQAEADSILDDMYPDEVTFYVVGSSDGADITVAVNGSISQQSDVAVPLKSKSGRSGLTVSAGRGDFVSIQAQRKSDDGGTIRCRIEAGGEVIDEAESSGPYTIAACSGSMPG